MMNTYESAVPNVLSIPFSHVAFRTERLVISGISENDHDIRDVFLDADVMRFYPHLDLQALAHNWITFCRQQIRDHGYAPLIARTRSGELVGTCGPLHQIVENRPEAESVCFFHRKFWRGGYTLEASLATLAWMSDALGIHSSIGLIDPKNRPSIIHGIRCGFVYERNIEFLGREVMLVRRGRASAAGAGPREAMTTAIGTTAHA